MGDGWYHQRSGGGGGQCGGRVVKGLQCEDKKIIAGTVEKRGKLRIQSGGHGQAGWNVCNLHELKGCDMSVEEEVASWEMVRAQLRVSVAQTER